MPIPVIRLSISLLLGAGLAKTYGLVLSGKVLDPNGVARAGAKVTLASSGLSATTDASGDWSLGGTTGIQAHRTASGHVSRNLSLDRCRLRVELQGRDPSGRAIGPRGAVAGDGATDPTRLSARIAGAVDTLVYSVGTRVFLRDTVSTDRSGMVRTYDTTWNASIVYGWLSDSRDGRTYRTVKIGQQIWMAQNLDYRGVSNDTGKCYNDTVGYCAKFGRLYDWNVAMNGSPSSASSPSGIRGVCPVGWHVPSDSEWQALEIALGMPPADAATIGYRGDGEASLLRALEGWIVGNARPFDWYGFRGLPGGYAYGDGFVYTGYTGTWWTSTEYGTTGIWTRDMSFSNVNLGRNNGSTKTAYGRSVRCVSD